MFFFKLDHIHVSSQWISETQLWATVKLFSLTLVTYQLGLQADVWNVTEIFHNRKTPNWMFCWSSWTTEAAWFERVQFLKNQFGDLDYVKQAVWFNRFEMRPQLLQLFWRNLQGWFSGNRTMTESSLLGDPWTNWLAVISLLYSNWCGVVVLLFLAATVSRDESFSRIASKTSWSRCIIEPRPFLSWKPSLIFADDVPG